MNTPPVITVDGPSGSGKGTLSRLLAKKLGWHWLDSGAIYRLLGLSALRQGVDVTDTQQLLGLARDLPAEFTDDHQGEAQVMLGGKLVTRELRTEECGNMASQIAAVPEIRQALLQRQRDFCKEPGLVADGRDMGTVVFPQAQLKIFLTASTEERAKRRYKQLKEKGFDISIDALSRELAARDARDTGRDTAPLRPAEDATVIDCSSMTIDEMLACAQRLIDANMH